MMKLDSLTTEAYKNEDEWRHRDLIREKSQHNLVIAPPSEADWIEYFRYADSFGHNCGRRKGFYEWLNLKRKNRINE